LLTEEDSAAANEHSATLSLELMKVIRISNISESAIKNFNQEMKDIIQKNISVMLEPEKELPQTLIELSILGDFFQSIKSHLYLKFNPHERILKQSSKRPEWGWAYVKAI
jgi:hypothetical protein